MKEHKNIRTNLMDRLNISELKKRNPDQMLAEIKRMTVSLLEIVNYAKPRLIMGGIRYGSEWSHENLMDYMQNKFDIYKKTGNFETLIDFVNFCAIENSLQTHPKYHFEAEDRK